MRRLLSSSNALMVAVLVLLAAIAMWTIFASGEETVASGETDEPSARQTARGGGPLGGTEESNAPELDDRPQDDKPRQSDEEPDLDLPDIKALGPDDPALDEPVVDESVLDQPELEASDDSQSGLEAEADEPTDQDEGDPVDQEAAFRTDEAPEADVIGVQPADSDERAGDDEEQREGGGPIDDGDVVESVPEGAVEGDRAAGEAAGEDEAEGEADEEVVESDDLAADEEFPQDVDGDEPTGSEEPAPSPSEEAESDDSTIDRPSLRSAPRPSRPAEE